MRKHLLLFVAITIATSASAQFYVSASGGLSMGSAGILLGTSLNDTQTEAKNHYGSYGEGLNAQLMGGYFFNDMFGLELGLGYLHGSDQTIDSYKVNDAGTIAEFTEGIARGRAYGLNISLVYKFNEKIYGKIGAITKLGGKTEAIFTKTTPTPLGPILAEGVTDYHGRIPLGFTASIGHKFELNDNLNLFAELEYLGINVTRDNSEFQELAINYPAVAAVTIPDGTWNLGEAPLSHPVFGTIYAPTEITYVDTLANPNTDPSKALSSVVPYSSFGINFGITYTFSKKEKSTM